jgi:hypothetical protein
MGADGDLVSAGAGGFARLTGTQPFKKLQT